MLVILDLFNIAWDVRPQTNYRHAMQILNFKRSQNESIGLHYRKTKIRELFILDEETKTALTSLNINRYVRDEIVKNVI